MHPSIHGDIIQGDNKFTKRLGKGVAKGHNGLGGSWSRETALCFKAVLKTGLTYGSGKAWAALDWITNIQGVGRGLGNPGLR
jgi:hypothetical protein